MITAIALLWIIAIIQFILFIRTHKQIKTSFPFSSKINKLEKKEKYGKINNRATDFFEEFANFLYSDYYAIKKVYAYKYYPKLDKENPFEKNTEYFFVVIEKKLKFNFVQELPFVQGMKNGVDITGNNPIALKMYKTKIDELKKYIGTWQTENNIFKVRFTDSEKKFETSEITIATYNDETPAIELKSPSFEQMYKEGADFIKKSARVKKIKTVYQCKKAIDYADRYTSNPVNKNADKRFWNKDYSYYENDCANFVSQCIHAAGVETTSIWKPDSLLWIRTGSPKYEYKGVTNYMKRKNIFFNTTYSGISAGGFICLVKESHVVMVTSNDSITVLFNAHTNDRKRVSFPKLSNEEALYLTPNFNL